MPTRASSLAGWKESFSSQEMMTAPGIDGRSRLAALLVVLHGLVDLLPDDLPLIRLLVGSDAPLERSQFTFDAGAPGMAFCLPPRTGELAAFGITQDFEPRTSLSISLAVRRPDGTTRQTAACGWRRR